MPEGQKPPDPSGRSAFAGSLMHDDAPGVSLLARFRERSSAYWSYRKAIWRQWSTDLQGFILQHLGVEALLILAGIVIQVLQAMERDARLLDAVLSGVKGGFAVLLAIIIIMGIIFAFLAPYRVWTARGAKLETWASDYHNLHIYYMERIAELGKKHSEEIEDFQAKLARVGPMRFEIVLDWEKEFTYAKLYRIAEDLGGSDSFVTRTLLSVMLLLRFQNHDPAGSTVTGLHTGLWLTAEEQAEELRLLKWELYDEAGSYKATDPGELSVFVPGRKLTGNYRLRVEKMYSEEVKAKASAATFLRFTVLSLGNPEWHVDVPLSELEK